MMADKRTKFARYESKRKEAETVWATIDGKIVRQTEKGLAFLTETRTIWLPKSQIFSLEYEEGGDISEILLRRQVRSVEVPRWLADEKDLDYGEWDEEPAEE